MYNNGKIYKISNSRGQFYIGSTCKSLSRRLYEHRAMYKLYQKSGSNYTTSFLVLGGHNVIIELLEVFPCAAKQELARKEGEYHRRFPDCVNKNVAGRTREEYNRDNAERLKTYHRQWSLSKEQHLKEYRRNYYLRNKEKMKLASKLTYWKNKTLA